MEPEAPRTKPLYPLSFGISARPGRSHYKPLAVVFVLSLVASIVFGIYGPRFLGLDYRPQWMLWTHLGLGLISVLTVPFAWRSLLRQRSA